MLFYNIPLLAEEGNIIGDPFIVWSFALERRFFTMNFVVTIDWKFVVALGAVAGGTIFAVKMDADAAERVSSRVVDACKEYAVAGNGSR